MTAGQYDLNDLVPESWACIDCDFDTAPGVMNRVQLEQTMVAIRAQTFGEYSEVYAVRVRVWKAARMAPTDGCLCIGCLEKRIGRRLKPADFPRNHPFNSLPGTERLMSRRDGWDDEAQS